MRNFWNSRICVSTCICISSCGLSSSPRYDARRRNDDKRAGAVILNFRQRADRDSCARSSMRASRGICINDAASRSPFSGTGTGQVSQLTSEIARSCPKREPLSVIARFSRGKRSTGADRSRPRSFSLSFSSPYTALLSISRKVRNKEKYAAERVIGHFITCNVGEP